MAGCFSFFSIKVETILDINIKTILFLLSCFLMVQYLQCLYSSFCFGFSSFQILAFTTIGGSVTHDSYSSYL